MIGRRALAATAAVAALSLAAIGCGDDEASEDASTDYAAAVEAIMTEQVDPAATAATDAVTNVAQGDRNVEEVVQELRGASAELHAARGELAELDPPEAAAVPAEELYARIGVLADRLAEATVAEVEADPLTFADNIQTDMSRIENRANQAIEADGGTPAGG